MHWILLAMVLLATARPAGAAEIRHRFLAVDESRSQLLYVDQTDPARDWALALPGRYRDIQLVGGNRLLLAGMDGYREHDLADRKLVKEVKGFPGSVAARRQPDGRTILACNQQGVTVHDLSATDQVLRKAVFRVPQTRLVRLTPAGTLLFGSGERVYEGDWSGSVVRSFSLGQGAWVYQALRKPDGHLLVAAGYTPRVVELDAEGRTVRALGGKDTAEGKTLSCHFFAGMQVLRGGDVVVCNWTGHGANDSAKGAQILQFDAAGQVVWKWHDPARAGTIHAVIVLDDLDTGVLNDDVSSILGAAK